MRGAIPGLALMVLGGAVAAQDEQALLAAFDRAHESWRDVTDDGDAARRASDAFLRLPFGRERDLRIASGAQVTLAVGRAEEALAMTTAARAAGLPADGALVRTHLTALVRMSRLSEFARLARADQRTHAEAVAAVLRGEESRLLPLAAAALRSEAPDAGRFVFERLAALEPVQSYRLANLALCLRQLGDVEAAFATYARGRELAPDDIELLNDYGLLLRATGRRAEAIAAFRRSVRIDLRRPEPLRGRGPAITNLMHSEALAPGTVGQDPLPTAQAALAKRPEAELLRRLTLDVQLDRLQRAGVPSR